MSDFIVNESKFIVDMDEKADSFLSAGEILPDGLQVSDMLDNAAVWQIYASEDNSALILAVMPDLAKRWVAEGYIKESAVFHHVSGGREVALLISPSSLIVSPVTAVRFEHSQNYARSFFCALFNSRLKNHEINLRDSIFFELYDVLLPTYTLTRNVADKAIFNNASGLSLTEDLSSPDDLTDPGVSYPYLLKILRDTDCNVCSCEPYLVQGERVDDFLTVEGASVITGPLVIREDFQVFATDSDKVVLLMENDFALSMVEAGLIEQMDLKSVQLGFGVLRALVLNRRFAVECLDDRHYGLTVNSSLKLASTIYRMRVKNAQASLNNGLYLEEKGIILANNAESKVNDAALMRSIMLEGPFALAPFSYEDIDDAVTLASRR